MGIKYYDDKIICRFIGNRTVTINTDIQDAYAAVEYLTGNTTNYHIVTYALYICAPYVLESLSDTVKAKIIAHEIGHAYGLGHTIQSNHIMYGTGSDTWKASAYVTSQDIWGMKVVTHAHMHNPATITGQYYLLDDTYHQVLCSSCKALILQAHTYNLYNICTRCGYQLI